MRLSDFDYPLPSELIAQTPAERRDASRLLVVRGEAVQHRAFAELPDLLPSGALLVVNDARVIPARLHARKPTGGQVEIFLLEPRGPEGSTQVWACLVRAKSLADGTELALLPPRSGAPGGSPPRVTFLGRVEGEARVAIDGPVHDWGEIPLPPYIERAPTEDDRERYQTVFAETPGAVAAPTAGLHFTGATLEALAGRGIERASVTLHVGPGTFAPVREEDLERHVMHVERYHVPEATARAYDAARAAGRPVVAVGTTVVRTLESALGTDGSLAPGAGETRLFIHPPATVRCADILLTNFHMPRSTLFMLVCAFAGHARMRAAYAEAIAQRYRFFSYGDATLLWKAPT